MSPTTRETADARVWSQHIKIATTTSATNHHHGRTAPAHDKDDGQGARYFAQNSRACAVIPGFLLCLVSPLFFIFPDFIPFHGVPLFPPSMWFPNYCIFGVNNLTLFIGHCMPLPPVLKILAHIILSHFSSHLFSLGVLEFFITGGVLAITQYSRRARY